MYKFKTKALAEAGIVLSKLSALISTSTFDNGVVTDQKKFQFLPQRYSRQYPSFFFFFCFLGVIPIISLFAW